MIRLIRKKDLLYFSDQPRREYDIDKTTLLYTYPDLEMNERLRQTLRPYRYLGRKFAEYYKLSLLPELPDILYSEPSLVTTGQEEHKRVCRGIDQVMRLFGIQGNEELDYEILYTCDTWNYLSDKYGEDNIQKAKEYLGLSRENQSLVRQIWEASGINKKLEIAKTGDWISVYDLLEDQVKDNLLLFGDYDRLGEQQGLPEFKRSDILGTELPDLRDMIYSEFKLGEILMVGEGAQETKDRLSRIYMACGIDKTPKIKDLEEFFILVPCWQKGKRGYRVDFRK